MRVALIPLSLNCLISTHSNNGFITVNGGLLQVQSVLLLADTAGEFHCDKRSEIKTAANYGVEDKYTKCSSNSKLIRQERIMLT